MVRIFLGGTCNGSTWRDKFIPMIKNKYIDCYNPTTKRWNKESKKLEDDYKEHCDYEVYVITPKLTGLYSIFELTKSACFKPRKTILCVLDEDENLHYSLKVEKSLDAIMKSVIRMGVPVFKSLEDTADYIRKKTIVNYKYPTVVDFVTDSSGI